MKIGLVCPQDFTVVLCCKWIIKYLQQLGHEVLVISPINKNDNFYSNKIKEFGVEHIDIKMNRHLNILDDIKYLLSLYKIFNKYKLNSVFGVCTKPNIYAPIAAKIANINNIYISIWGRGTTFLPTKSLNKKLIKLFLISLYRLSFSLSSKIWFTNPNDLNYFLDRKIINSKKIILTKNYIDSDIYKPSVLSNQTRINLLNEFSFNEKDIIIILVGRMIWSKGVKEFVDAAHVLSKDFPHLKFLLVGAEEKRNYDSVPSEYLLNLVNYNYIRWTGFRTDIPDLYALSTIAVLPSYYKEGGYPRGITEPMSMEKPVIAANTIDCSLAISDKEDGLLVKPQDSEDLVSKIKYLLNNQSEMHEISKKARIKILNEFDEKNIIKDLIYKLY